MEVIKEFPSQYTCEIHGDGFWREQISEVCAAADNLNFHGIYRNPEDLESVYTGVDLVVALYDASDPNVRLALPNKLYEAAYFARPLIVTAGTALAQRVAEWGVGYAIDSSSKASVRKFLTDLKLEDIEHKSARCGQIPDTMLASDPSIFLCNLRLCIGIDGSDTVI
jgi:glycosyltransferase involved in cell wall biosynthesis